MNARPGLRRRGKPRSRLSCRCAPRPRCGAPAGSRGVRARPVRCRAQKSCAAGAARRPARPVPDSLHPSHDTATSPWDGACLRSWNAAPEYCKFGIRIRMADLSLSFLSKTMPMILRPTPVSIASLLLCAGAFSAVAQAQTRGEATLGEVVVSGNRSEQRRFDVPGAIDAVQVDPMRLGSPLVNLSELMSAVPGVQVRNRENYAQDLQLSVRGFGTRSTFGVRGVRILIDGIPATMPDGQGQVSSISLTSAKRIELLRGPLAQLYGNAAGGVLQVFTKDPPVSATPQFGVGVGAGSDGQRQLDLSVGGGSETLGALLDVSR